MTKQRVASVLPKAFLWLMVAACVFPLYLTLINIFKPTAQISANPLALPIPPTIDNLMNVLTNPNVNLPLMYKNSLVLALGGTLVCVCVSATAAYYLARVKNRFTDFAYVYFLVGLMVPYVIVYVPMVTLYKGIGLIGSTLGLILIFASGSVSFSVFMYYGFIRGLPLELEEAASIDGAGSGTIFFRILFPLLKPCTATTVIFIGLSMWNDFLTPLIIGQVKTITVGIYSAIGPYSSDYGTIFAFVFLATLPVLVTYLCLQDQFISGLTAGAMKG